jgi:hypothetical protein
MDFLKKEWKVVILIICLVGMVVFLSQINSQLAELNAQNAKLIATIDSIESVSFSTDSVIKDLSKKVEGIDANTSYVVQRLRRR